ncbi:DUF4115 domain-containing protein [Curvibacter sp. HBC61]|uniref:DUF4115 domain-containing protein n=1 Tax=Curvibacter cyanobacteriorum TaxID=3026422 RepID=A0ABT5MTM1_9BURK|nr:helix-turn-helix domain-containing protein [Curvibacter sp. HBC61]MDD0837245.1 DUF4115 domain-containing protein [Curvibacter sp. HBC61]
MKQAREAAGMHVAALAVALKVPVSKLEALEADRLDDLPDAVFVRALASSVCRTLRVDAAPILALLPQTQRPHLKADDSGINTPFRAPNERRLRLVPEQWFSPTLLAVPLLCVGALALYLWPRAPEVVAVAEPTQTAPGVAAPESTPPVADSPASAPVASTGTVALPAGTRTEVVSSPALAAAAPAATSVAPVAPVAPAVTAPVAPAVTAPAAAAPGLAATSVQASKSVVIPPAVAAVAPAPGAATTSAASPAATAAAPATPAAPATAAVDSAASVLSFSASGTSWIKVTDARGVVALQKTLNAGETASASGQPPFAVVVGKVDVTQLQVRGKAFDLQSVARENVARFEVK